MRVAMDRAITWLVGSSLRIAIATGVAVLLTFGVKVAAIWLLFHDAYRHEGLIFTDGIISGLLAGALVALLLGLVRARRRRLIDYVRRVAELNHHVRNSLQVIVYHAALANIPAEDVVQIEQAVKRVDAALNEVFPIIGQRGADFGEKLQAEGRPRSPGGAAIHAEKFAGGFNPRKGP